MKKRPLISVLMSAYNADKSIKIAIQSILNQTFSDFEFIIINDGSTDKTLQIINTFDDKRIICIDKPKNQGLIVALNDGINIAQGEYIARMDADDESLPERFALQIDFFNKNSNIDILGTAMFFIGQTSSEVKISPTTHEQCLDRLVHGVCVFHPTVMLKKEILNNIKYNEKYHYAEDYKLWVDLAKQGAKFANLIKPLVKYNLHGENISIIKNNEQKHTASLIQREYLEFYFGVDAKKYQKELDFITGLHKEKVSLKSISNFYNFINNTKTIKASDMINKRTIRDNIGILIYNFEKVHPLLLNYYLRYIIKRFFKRSI